MDNPVTGNKVVVPVEIDGFGTQNNIRIDSNAVTSVYGKNNAVSGMLARALDSEYNGNVSVFYWNKNEAVSLLQRAGLQLPSGLPQDGFIHSIRENGSKVNMKFENETESQQFKRWLKGYFNGVDKRILDFVNQHKKGNFERLNLDPVSDRLKEDIRELTGQNLDGYIFAMNSNAVEHIQQRHGKFGAADHSMAHSDDIARALYV